MKNLVFHQWAVSIGDQHNEREEKTGKKVVSLELEGHTKPMTKDEAEKFKGWAEKFFLDYFGERRKHEQ